MHSVLWVQRVGLVQYPYRYPGLSNSSSRTEIQARLYTTLPTAKCPKPAGSKAEVLPTFAEALGLNETQLAAYKKLRKARTAYLASPAFKMLSPPDRTAKRADLAKEGIEQMKGLLNVSQLALFSNSSLLPRRPPSFHIAEVKKTKMV